MIFSFSKGLAAFWDPFEIGLAIFLKTFSKGLAAFSVTFSEVWLLFLEISIRTGLAAFQKENSISKGLATFLEITISNGLATLLACDQFPKKENLVS